MGSSEKSTIVQIYNYLDSSFLVVVVMELKKAWPSSLLLFFICPKNVGGWCCSCPTPIFLFGNKKIHMKR